MATSAKKTRQELQEEAEERDSNPEHPHDKAPFKGGLFWKQVGPPTRPTLVAVNCKDQPIDENGNVVKGAQPEGEESPVEGLEDELPQE